MAHRDRPAPARLLDGRQAGPLFLTERRARVELPPADLDPATGRARLSYRRAAESFEHTTEHPGGPWTLHQLRPSALTHAAEDGANTSTLLATLQNRLHSNVRKGSILNVESLPFLRPGAIRRRGAAAAR